MPLAYGIVSATEKKDEFAIRIGFCIRVHKLSDLIKRPETKELRRIDARQCDWRRKMPDMADDRATAP